MHSIEIEEKGKDYIVTFQMPGIREENILIKGEDNSLNVIALNKTVATDMKDGKINIDYKSVVYDKTAILDIPDFSKMTYVFLAGWLEVTVPKNYKLKTKEDE